MKWLKVFVAALMMGTSACAQRDRYTAVVKEVLPTTVTIEVETDIPLFAMFPEITVPGKVMGAGVYVSPNGHILTCAHLFTVGPNKRITVTDHFGRQFEATLLYGDEHKDLAMLKVESGVNDYAVLAYPGRLQVGQDVILVGNPHGFDETVSVGIVSALNRDLKDGYNFLQTDAASNPGNSGGPLFDMDGRLIGILVRGVPNAQGLNFCVEVAQLREFLTKFKHADAAL